MIIANVFILDPQCLLGKNRLYSVFISLFWTSSNNNSHENNTSFPEYYTQLTKDYSTTLNMILEQYFKSYTPNICDVYF